MHLSSLVRVFSRALLLMLATVSCSDSSSSIRDISNFKINQTPQVIGKNLPHSWAVLFDEVMSSAPALDIDDPHSLKT
ncbi:MAG: hypothetical protein QGF46_08930, partial [Planctomycetota bacterium]|nr:hypothetical protein [Planctomycetota bacterium]